jgi:hypothetical protein
MQPRYGALIPREVQLEEPDPPHQCRDLGGRAPAPRPRATFRWARPRGAPRRPPVTFLPVRTCIYCRGSGDDLVFNSEHVLSQGFGMFEQNLTLVDEVCQDCNSTLGADVETPGIRGSIEGVHRFKAGKLRSVSRLLKTPRDRVTFELGEPGWQDVQAYHVPTDDGEDVRVMFHPQVVVDFRNGRTKSFLLKDLAEAEAGVLKDADRFRLYADSDEEQAALVEALDRLGIRPVWGDPIPMPPGENGEALVKVSAVYDDVVRRLMAKMAFNYLARLVSRA